MYVTHFIMCMYHVLRNFIYVMKRSALELIQDQVDAATDEDLELDLRLRLEKA